MATLKDKAEQILNEKNEKIIPENIKKDVQIFDVVGTLESSDYSGTITPEEYNEVLNISNNILGVEPEPDWQSESSLEITSVSASDGLHPTVTVYRDDNNIYNVGFKVHNGANTDTLYVSGIFNTNLDPWMDSNIEGFNLDNDYSYYDNEDAILEVLNFQFKGSEPQPTPQPDWQLIHTFTLDNPVSSDNYKPVVEVHKDVNGVETGTLFIINNNSNVEYLDITYEPDSMITVMSTDSFPVNHLTQSVEPDNVDLNYVENNFTFIWRKIPNKIEVTTPPTKTEYTEGEVFSPEGMVITATYSDETTEEIEHYSCFPTEALTSDITEMTIKYGDNTTTQSITVKPAPRIDIQNEGSYTITPKEIVETEPSIQLSTDGYTIIGSGSHQIYMTYDSEHNCNYINVAGNFDYSFKGVYIWSQAVAETYDITSEWDGPGWYDTAWSKKKQTEFPNMEFDNITISTDDGTTAELPEDYQKLLNIVCDIHLK